MASNASEVRDLSESATEFRALQSLQRNFSHMLISSKKEVGPTITFGKNKLVFKPQIPATAMVELLGNDNKVEGLRNYIRIALLPESREYFDELQHDIPLEGLNAIVEVISEAATPLDTKK